MAETDIRFNLQTFKQLGNLNEVMGTKTNISFWVVSLQIDGQH